MVKNNFWQALPRPFFVLAPMEAVTDTVFRHVVAAATPPDGYFSEFTNATSWARAGDTAIGTRLLKSDEKPLVAQLWGASPDDMAALARHCAELGYDGLDLNTGCPEKHAIKSNGGAALIRNPALTSELIAALRGSGLPVSVKCRLGYSSLGEWRDWIGHLLSHDLSALTVHLRTKKEMSKVPAHWEIMPEIIKLRDEIAPGTLIIGNGDVHDRQHGQQLIADTGCDGIMIGRGIFSNPFGFEPTPRTHSRQELMNLLNLHLDLYDQLAETHSPRPFETLKRFFKIYIRDFAGASELRENLMHTHSTAEVREVLSAISSE